MAGPPFGADEIQHQESADALHLALLVGVPRVVAWNEDQAAIAAVGRAGDALVVLLRVEHVGAPVFRARSAREIDQHRVSLDADVGMGLEPEAALVLAIFDPEARALEIGRAGFLDRADDLGALESARDRLADRKFSAVVGVEMPALGVAGLSATVGVLDLGRRHRQTDDGVASFVRQDLIDQPIGPRTIGPLGAAQAGDEAVGDLARRCHSGAHRFDFGRSEQSAINCRRFVGVCTRFGRLLSASIGNENNGRSDKSSKILEETGAGEGIRTLDPNLGKVGSAVIAITRRYLSY